MTKILYVWSKPNETPVVFKTWADAKEMVKFNKGFYKVLYVEGKDIDYCPPNPNTKRFANRLLAR